MAHLAGARVGARLAFGNFVPLSVLPPRFTSRHRRRLVPLLAVVVAATTGLGCPGDTASRSDAAAGELRFHWVVPAGFEGAVSLYRAPADRASGDTRTHGTGEAVTVGEALPDGRLPVRLDEPQRILLRVDNRGTTPLRFWAPPHLPLPHEGDAALMAQCLCTGAVYEVPAGGSWTRVLEFGIRRRGAVSPLGVTHVIVLGEPPR